MLKGYQHQVCINVTQIPTFRDTLTKSVGWNSNFCSLVTFIIQAVCNILNHLAHNDRDIFGTVTRFQTANFLTNIFAQLARSVCFH